MLHRNINVLYEIHVFFRIHTFVITFMEHDFKYFVFIFQERISTQLNVWLQQWCVVVVKQQRQLKRKRRGSFRQTQGFLLTSLTRIPTSPRMRRRPFAKKIEKPKRQKVFSSSFEWSTKKCHQLFQVCDPKTYRQ